MTRTARPRPTVPPMVPGGFGRPADPKTEPSGFLHPYVTPREKR